MIAEGRPYAARGLTRRVTGALVVLGVLVMHGLGIGHGVHLPGHSELKTAEPATHHPIGTAHTTSTNAAPGMAGMAGMADGATIGHVAASHPPTAAALGPGLGVALVAITTTEDLAGHAGALCTAVLPVLLALLTLLLALAALHRPGYTAPVRTVRRHRVRGSPPTRHTTSLLLLCVSRT